MKKNIGLLIVGLILIVPLAMWLVMTPIPGRFVNFSVASRSLGQLAAITGMVLFSVNLILSSRLKFLENGFLGLNSLYARHHLIGGTALVLLLFHPIFLTMVYLSSSIATAAGFLLPNLGRVDIILGETALVVMIVALVITFYGNFAYQVWKFTHKFLGIAFIFAFLHLTKVTSDVSVNPALMIYLLALGILAICAYFYRAVFGSILVKRVNYFVKKVTKLNDECYEVSMTPEKEKLRYFPGQFIFIKAIGSKVSSEEHPFSITSTPKEDDLKIVIKALGDYTIKIGFLKEGTKIEIEGPFGRFSPHFTGGNNFIFIAGGIGITPFLGIIKEKSDAKIDLYYSVHDEKEMVFSDELKNNSAIRFFPYISTSSHLTAELIAKKSGGLNGKKIFVCGPKRLMRELKLQFVGVGVPADNIYSEDFDL